MGSKSLNRCKKVGVKFTDPFLETEWLERSLSLFSMILPLDFSEILNICRDYSLFYVPAQFTMSRHQLSK